MDRKEGDICGEKCPVYICGKVCSYAVTFIKYGNLFNFLIFQKKNIRNQRPQKSVMIIHFEVKKRLRYLLVIGK